MMKKSVKRSLRGWIVFAILVMISPNLSPAGQSGTSDPDESKIHPFTGLAELLPPATADSSETYSSYTYHQANGNRTISGHGNLPHAQTVDIPLLDSPQWVVGFPFGISSLWVVSLTDGRVQAFILTGDTVESFTPELLPYPVLSPPALVLLDESIQLMFSPVVGSSQTTHPILLSHPDPVFASINNNGGLVVWEHGRTTNLHIDALTDSRLVTDDTGRILILTNPSMRYNHGILGDRIEPTRITLIETIPCTQVATTISIPHPQVIESLAAIWEDLDGDGSREILVTVSDAVNGAQLIAYSETGLQRATGPAVGRGYRWRHQLAVAPFGPNGEIEMASVLTPHIGGVVEFYRLVDDRLDIVATVPGYSTHAIGSRNLDMALAADLDSDGHIELLVPNQQFNTLGAIQRTIEGAKVDWTIPIGGRIITNIGAVKLTDDTIVIAAGHAGNILRVWIP